MTYPTVMLEPTIQPMRMERRSKTRYPLMLKVRYRTLGQSLLFGEGRVVNMSSVGILVVSQHELNVGAELEMRVEWPSLLDGLIPLQLVALGKVLRCGPSSFAVLFRKYQFQTMRSKVQSVAVSAADPLEQFAKHAIA
jgi:hypothetical protein